MPIPTKPEPKSARKAIDLYVKLTESLRADGYGQDAIEPLTVTHLVGLVRGGLRELDGSAFLPTVTDGDGQGLRVSDRSLSLMRQLLDVLRDVDSLGTPERLFDVVGGLGRATW